MYSHYQFSDQEKLSDLRTGFSKVCFLCSTYRWGKPSRNLLLMISSDEGTDCTSPAFYHPQYKSHP